MSTNDEIVRVYSTAEASAILRLTSDHIRLLARQGKIKHIRRNGRIRFTAQQLNEYLLGDSK